MTDAKNIAERFNGKIGTVTLGIDGYVDEVWQIVDTRNENNEVVPYSKMRQYAERIIRHGGGGSLSAEIVRKRRSFGGFTANTGNAVCKLGVPTVMLSLYGRDRIDPVFEPFNRVCRVISIGDPAMTNIFEFDDGKIMMPFIEPIIGLDWKYVTKALGAETLAGLLAESEIIAVGYWSSMPAFDEVAARLCESLPRDGKKRRVFYDFADLRKRDEASLNKTLRIIGELNDIVPITLSMNENEAETIFGLFGEALDAERPPELERVENVRKRMGLDEIVVHTRYYAAAAASDESAAEAAQEFCEKPVRTTGGGDTFNGGYLAARAAGLNIAERLSFANAVVSYFIKYGEAPTLEQAVGEIDGK